MGSQQGCVGSLRGSRVMADLQDQAIRQHCKTLRMSIGSPFACLAQSPHRSKNGHPHLVAQTFV